MKELVELFEKDIMSEHFTKKEIVIYGIIAPVVLVAACMLAAIVETL